MIIVLKPDASEREVDHIIDRLRELGLKSHISAGQERTIIGVIGDDRILHNQPLTALPGVESVLPILAPWKLVSREFKKREHHYRCEWREDRRQKNYDHGRPLRGRTVGTHRGHCA